MAAFADALGDVDQMIEGTGDRARGVKGEKNAGENREQGTDRGKNGAERRGRTRRTVGVVERFADGVVGGVQNIGRSRNPSAGIVLQVIDLKIGDGGVAGIDLVALGDHWLGKIFEPIVLGFVHLGESVAEIGVGALAFAFLELLEKLGDAFVGFVFV